MSPTTFIAISFLYFFFHHPDSLICTKDDRDLFCTQELDPVCALYTGDDCDSPNGYCLKTISNKCTACATDQSVIGYILGDCPNVPVQSCSQEHSSVSCAVMEIPKYVCGITEETGLDGIPHLKKQSSDNGCQACLTFNSSFYLGGETLGECRAISESNICRPNQKFPDGCDSAMPACAYYTGGDCPAGEQLCRKTVENYCAACSNPDVLFFFNGDCAELVPIGANGILIEEDFLPEEEVVEEEVVEEEVVEEEEEQPPLPVSQKKTSHKKLKKGVSKFVAFPKN